MIDTIEELDSFFLEYMPIPGYTGELRENRLSRMEALLEHLGNPERCYRKIHLAGSKGKGTTAVMLATLLSASGEKTGVFLSPHVYDLRERFQSAEGFYPEEDYIRTANELEEKLKTFEGGRPTTFEMYTAYAFLLFRNTGMTAAVIETGLGGRKDATNVIRSDISVLMPIELEHTQILGSTVEEIAVEKSKIIKKDSRCYIADMVPEARDVFVREAEAQHTVSTVFGDAVKGYTYEDRPGYAHISFEIDGKEYELRTRMVTREMLKNMALAVLIGKREGFLTDEGLRRLEELRIPGRFETRYDGGKTLIMDVAHTKNSMNNTIDCFREMYPDRRNTAILFSFVEGKAHDEMIRRIMSSFDKVVITKAGTFKKSDPDELFRIADGYRHEGQLIFIEKDEKKALDLAKTLGDIVLITGSFYLVGGYTEGRSLC